jgi:hypothetical protein
MIVKELIKNNMFNVANIGKNQEQLISKVFCCDLLSIAMSKAPSDSAWVTVMGNMNTLAVASLADVACIIFAEGVMLDEVSLEKAKMQGITVLYTGLPIFDAALNVHQLI